MSTHSVQYKCAECGKTFSQLRDLFTHRREEHREENPASKRPAPKLGWDDEYEDDEEWA